MELRIVSLSLASHDPVLCYIRLKYCCFFMLEAQIVGMTKQISVFLYKTHLTFDFY